MTTEGTDSGDPGDVNLWRVDEVERRQPTPTVDQDHLSIVDRRHVGAWPTHLRVPGNESWTMEPNSTSTGVGVLTSVLNLSPPFTGWMRNTAIFGVLVGGIKKISRRVDVHPAGPDRKSTPNRSLRVRRYPARSRTLSRCYVRGSYCRGSAPIRAV